MRYKLIFDAYLCLADALGQETEARRRMARYGQWQDGGWWEPNPSQQKHAEERIEREGFVVIERLGL